MILEMIMDNPKITQVAIAEELQITTRSVKRNIRLLIDEGFVERVGSARGGSWKAKV